jgi:hypothetical protein
MGQVNRVDGYPQWFQHRAIFHAQPIRQQMHTSLIPCHELPHGTILRTMPRETNRRAKIQVTLPAEFTLPARDGWIDRDALSCLCDGTEFVP